MAIVCVMRKNCIQFYSLVIVVTSRRLFDDSQKAHQGGGEEGAEDEEEEEEEVEVEEEVGLPTIRVSQIFCAWYHYNGVIATFSQKRK